MKKTILLILFFISINKFSRAQWATSSNNTTTYTLNNIGIGTTSPNPGFLLEIGSSTVRGTVNVLSTSMPPAINLSDNRTNGHPYTIYSGLSQVGSFDVFDQAAQQFRLAIDPNGNVGIGTANPGCRLDVNGLSRLGGGIDYAGNVVLSVAPGTIGFDAPGQPGGRLTISGTSGNVLIGKNTQQNTSYKLDVAGSVRSNAIVVNTSGADYVFKKDYNLPRLSEVKAYIDKNHHLSEIPSAAQMENNGVDLGEMNIKLLKKVEELTLYLIEKENKEKLQTKKIENLEKQFATFKKQSRIMK